MREKLNRIFEEAKAELEQAADETVLEQARVKYLGRKGVLTTALKGLGSLSPEERPAIGKLANEIKDGLTVAIEAAASRLRSTSGGPSRRLTSPDPADGRKWGVCIR